MVGNLIIAGVVVVALALILVRWRLVRVVLIESLSHPLRTTVIKIKSARSSDAEKASNDNRKAQQRVAVNN